MKLTHHSKLRMRDRMNVEKRKQRQFFRNALSNGKSPNELKEGEIKNYLSSKKGHKCGVKLYQGYIFIYNRNSKRLYTVYELPKELKENS